MIEELGINHASGKICCDSESVIHFANHHVYHEKTKHIDIRYHELGECG